MHARRQYASVVENDEISLAQVLIELVEARMLEGSKLAIDDQHARLLARLERVLRDQVRGEIVVELGKTHRERKDPSTRKRTRTSRGLRGFHGFVVSIRDAAECSPPKGWARASRLRSTALGAARNRPSSPTPQMRGSDCCAPADSASANATVGISVRSHTKKNTAARVSANRG